MSIFLVSHSSSVSGCLCVYNKVIRSALSMERPIVWVESVTICLSGTASAQPSFHTFMLLSAWPICARNKLVRHCWQLTFTTGRAATEASKLQALHQSVKNCETTDPAAAELFFIPIYTGQYYHHLLTVSGLSHYECLQQITALVNEGLSIVKRDWRFWNQTNGLDHFIGAPLDLGRCYLLGGLSQQDMGDLFTVQICGDHFHRDFQTNSWYCYRPGRDIIIPSAFDTRLTVSDVVSPDLHQRNISILYRFVEGGRGDYGILRTALLDDAKADPIPGTLQGWATIEQTQADMMNSVFCVCPPGITQATLRMVRSIVFGCIPVTFFRGYDQPYEHFLHMDYSKFSVNINPDEFHLVRLVITRLLANKEKLAGLQSELKKVQTVFVNDRDTSGGVSQALLESLLVHPSRGISLRQVGA